MKILSRFDKRCGENLEMLAPLDQTVARKMMQNVPKSAVPELADRIITATALSLGLPLITKDHRIQESKLVSTVW